MEMGTCSECGDYEFLYQCPYCGDMFCADCMIDHIDIHEDCQEKESEDCQKKEKK